ncbi:casein kinase substrate phosphoprotein PP28-domain-containing protein [Hyaloraphidium curvatum]|nr:casein kinase substrate phosphoprotein PP28-domain-containing protein [Hyaloraphidium curvatum]
MRGRKKNYRGSGHKFSKNLAPLQFDADGNLIEDEKDKEEPKKRRGARPAGQGGDEDDESGSDSDEDSEESSDEEGSSEEDSSGEKPDGAGKQPKAAPGGSAALIEISNPNRAKKSAKLSDLGKPAGDGDTHADEAGFRKDGQMSRREREAAEKERAKEAYWKAHLAGQTEQARADMARLALIRKQREEAAQRREAEQQAKTASKTASRNTSLASNKAIVTARVGNLGKDQPAAEEPAAAPAAPAASARGGSTAGAANRGGKASTGTRTKT